MKRLRFGALLLCLCLASSGCESMSRGLVSLYGIKTDPFPGPCAPESVQAGQCVAVTQGAK
jgi:hypothetical protein